MEFNKTNAIIVFALIAFVLILTFFFFKLKDTGQSDLYSNVFSCNNQLVPFRANITSCDAVAVSPGEETLSNTLSGPFVKGVVILVEPNNTGGVGVSAFEIYKILNSLKPRTSQRIGIAYTSLWPNQTNIPVMSIDNATFETPIIFLRTNQSKTNIEINGPKIFVNSKNQQGLDAASCKISISAIKKVLKC